MKFLSQPFRSALTGGLFAAVLLGLPAPFAALAAEITRESTLYPSEPILGGNFGTDIALFDDTVVVGNWIKGRAYVYRRAAGAWSEQHKFVKAGPSVEYGNAVAVHGDWMAIAARQEAGYTNNAGGVPIGVSQAGAVNLYQRDLTGAWNLHAEVGSPLPVIGGQYGNAVALTSNRLAVTQLFKRDAVNSGTVHIYEASSGGGWSLEASKLPFNPGNTNAFGFSVALAKTGDRLVVGSPDESSGNTGVNGTPIYGTGRASGAAYIYRREVTTTPVPATNWVQEAYVKASNTDPNDSFGYSVAMDETGDTVVVGAYKEDGNFSGVNGGQGNNGGSLTFDRGAAYVFQRPPGSTNWSQVAYLKPFGFNTNSGSQDYFGWSTAISGDTILVGAYNGTRDATYVFARSNGVWTTRQRLTNAPASTRIGYAVAIEGNVAAISAVNDSAQGTQVGAAFVYSGFAVAPPLPNPTVVFQPGGAAVDLTFYGVPGQQYLLQRSESLSPPTWITLQTLTAAPDGKVSYTDISPPAGGAFYRITPP